MNNSNYCLQKLNHYNDLVFNNIYKHRDLGTIMSSNRDEWIAKHINSDGTFNDIYVGDEKYGQDPDRTSIQLKAYQSIMLRFYQGKWHIISICQDMAKGHRNV